MSVHIILLLGGSPLWDDKDQKDNSIKPTNADTTKIINQTFDDAKNKARKAIAMGDNSQYMHIHLLYR